MRYALACVVRDSSLAIARLPFVGRHRRGSATASLPAKALPPAAYAAPAEISVHSHRPVPRALERTGKGLLFIFLAGLIAFSSVVALAAEPEFYSQCRKFLPRADDFAKECRERARPFSRTFYPSGGPRGETESYSAYFDTLSAPSHFVLGCILNFKHDLSFVGLYYTAQPLDMAHFDNDEIVSITPNDDVNLLIQGVQHTLIAARQFRTDEIPPRLKGAVANCENAGLETINGVNATAINGWHFRKLTDGKLEVCLADYCEAPHSYAVFFGPHDAPIVYALNKLILIDGDGTLLLQQQYYDNACKRWKSQPLDIYGIIYEMCGKKTAQ